MAPPLFAFRRTYRRIVRQPIVFSVALLLAVLGNVVAFRLFAGFDFYSGSIFSLLLLLRFGPLAGILGAILGAIPVAVIQGALWVPFFAAGEILFLSLVPVRKKAEYLVPLIALFWLVAGAPLVLLLMPKSSGLEAPLVFALNRLINGIANGVGATILHTLVSDRPRGGLAREHRFSYRSVIFIAMIAFVLLPSLFTLVLTMNREVDVVERRITERTELVLQAADQAATLRLRDYEHAVRTVSRAAELSGGLEGNALAMELRFAYQADRWIRFAGTWDREGRLLLAYGDAQSARTLRTYAITELEDDDMPLTLVRLEPQEPEETMASLGILVLVPVLDQGEVIGGVGMVVDANLLGHLLADLSEGWSITTAIVDSENRVIGASTPGVDALELLEEPLIPFNPDRLSGGPSFLMPGLSSSREEASPYERSRILSYNPSWRIVADTSLAPFQAELQGEALRSLFIVVAVLISAMGLGALVSASLVKSLGKLHKMTDTLPGTIEEEEERSWPSSRIKEIHTLIRRFRYNTQLIGEAFQELKQTNARLEEASDAAKTASRAKSDFLANVSHELRTPLNAVLGYAQYLQAEEGLKEEYREPVQTIRTSAEQLLEMIDDILEVSRLRNQSIVEKWDVFDLRSLLEHIARPFRIEAEDAGLRVTVHLDDTLPHFVRADQKHLRRILTNLLDNAIKFTEAGEVRLSASMVEKDRLRLTVSDTGIGISPEHLSEIFVPFNQQEETLTKKRSGTGLGLAIVRHLITLMHGEISAESTLGEGSTFTVDLPIAVVTSGNREAGSPERGAPQPEYLRGLMQVAGTGDVTHLSSLLEELEREDPQGAPFYREAKMLVDSFELDRLKELLRRHADG